MGVTLALALAAASVLAFWGMRRHARLEQERLITSLTAQGETERALLRERAQLAQQELGVLRVELESLRRALGAAREQSVRLEAELNSERSAGAEKLALLGEAREALTAQFKTLANDILEEKGKRLSEQSRGELDLLLRPLGEKIVAFEKKVEETYVHEAKERHSLADEVRKLQAANLQISQEALNLTRALKGEAKTRGNWGEVILERVLERSGLARGSEYEVQMTLSEGGARVRPDVVVRLPEERHIVIDSKVSLVAYDRYFAAQDEAGRERALAELLVSMRDHVSELAGKNYQSNAGLDAPDFVAMFVPIEPAYNLAAGSDESLYLDAFEKRVVIVTPGTLLAMLSTVATLWRREKQSKNAQEIARRSGDLYDKFKGFVDSLTEIGAKIAAAQEAYETAARSLSTGRGNLVRRVEDLRALGARAEKELPVGLVEQATASAAAAALPGTAGTSERPGAPLG